LRGVWQLIAIFEQSKHVSGYAVIVVNNWLPELNYKLKYSLLEQLAVLSDRKRKSAVRLTKNSKIIKTIIAAIQEKKGENIISLDLRKINEAVADFFIICEADNQPQLRAIAENIEEQVREHCDEKPYHHEGYKALQWILIDYVNVVVHVMLPENRRFYKLEEMWSDAAAENHED
jgi:ribosome-associated protein